MDDDEKLARAIMDRIERDGSVHLSSLVDEIRRVEDSQGLASLLEGSKVNDRPQTAQRRWQPSLGPTMADLEREIRRQQQEERHQRRAEALQRSQWERQF